jgi:acetolactate synthase I/II/III large subunit
LPLAKALDQGVVGLPMLCHIAPMGFASWYAYPVYEPRTYISSGYQGNLGSGFPTALGAKIAFPDRPVVAITGDGGFMFGVQELATAVQYGIAVVVLIFNNNAFGNVRRDQTNAFDGRLIGADLTNPDFVALAQAFGMAAARVDTPEIFRKTLVQALEAKAPWLIEIDTPTGSEANPWAFIHPRRHDNVEGTATIGDVFGR